MDFNFLYESQFLYIVKSATRACVCCGGFATELKNRLRRRWPPVTAVTAGPWEEWKVSPQ